MIILMKSYIKTHLPDKLELNEIQFTSPNSGDVIFNSKFIFDIQEQLSQLVLK